MLCYLESEFHPNDSATHPHTYGWVAEPEAWGPERPARASPPGLGWRGCRRTAGIARRGGRTGPEGPTRGSRRPTGSPWRGGWAATRAAGRWRPTSAGRPRRSTTRSPGTGSCGRRGPGGASRRRTTWPRRAPGRPRGGRGAATGAPSTAAAAARGAAGVLPGVAGAGGGGGRALRHEARHRRRRGGRRAQGLRDRERHGEGPLARADMRHAPRPRHPQVHGARVGGPRLRRDEQHGPEAQGRLQPRRHAGGGRPTRHSARRSHDAFSALPEDVRESAWEMGAAVGGRTDTRCLLTLYHRPTSSGWPCPQRPRPATRRSPGWGSSTRRPAPGTRWGACSGSCSPTTGASSPATAPSPGRSASAGARPGPTTATAAAPTRRGGCERNRPEIRKMLPKGPGGASLDAPGNADRALVMSEANSEPGGKLAWMAPMRAFAAAFGDDARAVLDALGMGAVGVDEPAPRGAARP